MDALIRVILIAEIPIVILALVWAAVAAFDYMFLRPRRIRKGLEACDKLIAMLG